MTVETVPRPITRASPSAPIGGKKTRRSENGMAVPTYLNAYSSLFVGRRDDYAVQLSTGRYKRARKPLTKVDLYDHLIGRRTYGSYVIDATGRCRFAVVDADSEDGLAR